MKRHPNLTFAAILLAFTVALCAYAATEPSPPAATPASKSVRIEFTVDELAVVQACMNAAVKVGGLSDARVILPVWDSIEAQAKQQLTEPASK